MKISMNFDRSEFSCKCGCGQDTIDIELIVILERLRSYFGFPIHIISGNRCEKYNREVGGVKNSQHILSKAADFYIEEITPKEIANYLNGAYPSRLGIGEYKTWVHLDVREERARWS